MANKLSKEYKIELGKSIRKLRENKGMTRDAFAEAVNISTQFETDIEKGNKAPSLATMIVICKTLGVPLDDLSPKNIYLHSVIEKRARNAYGELGSEGSKNSSKVGEEVTGIVCVIDEE